MIRQLILTLLASIAFCSQGFAADAMPAAEPQPAQEAPAAETPAEEAPAAEEEVTRCTAEQWCFDQDLPKTMCVHCDKKITVALKKDKDFCAEHNCAESLCVLCDPAAVGKLQALRPEQAVWPQDWRPKNVAAE